MWVGFIFSIFWMLDYALIETVYYANYQGYLDIVYIFGATFGVVTAWILGPHGEQGTQNDNFASGKKNNLFAFLGTLIIIVHFPTLNGQGGGYVTAGAKSDRAQIATFLAIIFGGFASVLISAMTNNGKFKMDHFTRSLFASALSMCGVHASMIPLWGVLIIAIPIGLLAPVLHKWFTEVMRKYAKLQDSTGVLSTFLIPGLYAAFWSFLFPLFFSDDIQDENY
jgi:ammonia channel protein AmtB